MPGERISIIAEQDLIYNDLVRVLLASGFVVDSLSSITSMQMAIEAIRLLAERDEILKPQAIILPTGFPDDLPSQPITVGHLVRGVIRQLLPDTKIIALGDQIEGCDGVINPQELNRAAQIIEAVLYH